MQWLFIQQENYARSWIGCHIENWPMFCLPYCNEMVGIDSIYENMFRFFVAWILSFITIGPRSCVKCGWSWVRLAQESVQYLFELAMSGFERFMALPIFDWPWARFVCDLYLARDALSYRSHPNFKQLMELHWLHRCGAVLPGWFSELGVFAHFSLCPDFL